MKKAVSLLASFTLAFSLFGAPVLSFADEGEEESSGQELLVATEDLSVLSDGPDSEMVDYLNGLFDDHEFTEADMPTSGSVEVLLTTLLVDPQGAGLLGVPAEQGGLTATLLKNGGEVAKASFATMHEGDLLGNSSLAKLENVAEGTYTLKVQGAGFVPYVQEGVQVLKGHRGKVVLLDQYSSMLCKEDSHEEKGERVLVDVCAGRGLLPYGDLNSDGYIGNGDGLALLQAIVRVRSGASQPDAEYAKYGMSLLKAKPVSVPEARSVEEPSAEQPSDEGAQQDPAAQPAMLSEEPVAQPSNDASDDFLQVSLVSEEPAVQALNEVSDDFLEVALMHAAGGEDANVESASRPEFRVETATEDRTADEAASVATVERSTFGTDNLTEKMPVGLNAFQKLASLRGARAATGKVEQKGETSHMQVKEAENTGLIPSDPAEVVETLFADDSETVTMYPKDDAPISETNPVQLTINAQDMPMEGISIAVPIDSPNAPTAGQVIVQRSDSDELITCDFVTEGVGGKIASVVDVRSSSFALPEPTARLSFLAGDDVANSTPEATVDKATGLITIDLKGQIPVKTITIRVTKTSSNTLAEIAQVEFLNGMENNIPAPELDIPTKLRVTTVGNKSISLAWEPQRNVTGYEVEISYNGSSSVISAVAPNATVTSMGGKELVNYRTYTLRARSVNGDWRSPWSQTITATPEASGAPKKPAAPKVTGAYDSINVSWSTAEDAETHNVWYRKKGEGNFTKIASETSLLKWVIPNLQRETTYEVYVEGVNRKGTGPKSDVVSATTTPDKVKVPWYYLYNREVIDKEKGQPTVDSVIEKVEGDNGSSASNDPYAMVDGDYNTYYSGKKGGYYHGGTVTFKQPLNMDTIVLTGYQGQSLNIYDMIVQAWDANNHPIKPSGGNIKFSTMTYDSKTRTVMIRTEELKGVKKIRVAYQRAVGNEWSASTIAELAFYNNTLYSEVMGLWADDEHTVLRDGVTVKTVEDLIDKVNTPDPACNELHPSKSVLLSELDNALIVARNGNLRAPIKVDGKLNVVGAARGVGGLNGWQPLGVAAAAGDEISVYVGRKGETSGDVPLAIYVVQNHPDLSNGFSARLDSTSNKVKIGLNTFRIPDNLTSIDMERGGSLYVEYGTGRGNNEQYTVRVSGGTEIPLLDIHNVTNADARMNLIRDYVKDLKAYDPAAEHDAKQHVTNTDSGAYDAQNCIANATDIVLADMMYSVPASLVAANIGLTASSSEAQVEAAAQKLSTSLSSMDDMIKLFYQHKGFVKASAQSTQAGYGANNLWPTLRQNIRYVRCSGGTFMYAAGNHIGVQWGSVGGLVASPGTQFDGSGKYQGGNYFGWGVAHEIGHEINNGAYTYAEVTNNYYSQLAQATDDVKNPKTRWGTYDSIYDRVSSGAKGMSMGKTGIAMYWQLHLAYDDGYNYKTYDNAADMYRNLIFARMDAYARNLTSAPQAAQNGRALTLTGANKDNAIMRLACAATQKNLLEFFEAWGLTPDATTIAYAEQWPKEERAIQYQTDALRLYRIGDLSQLGEYGVSTNNIGEAAKNAKVTAGLVYEPTPGRPNTTTQQSISVTLDNATVSSDILGYEVLRNGSVVGFLRANKFEECESDFIGSSATFVDTINTVNNRVFNYEVRAVDKLLHRGDLVSAGEVKVSHKNKISKAKWTVTTNMASGDFLANETHTVTKTIAGEEVVLDAEEYAGDVDKTANHPVSTAIDNSVLTSFSGTVLNADQGDARITIDFGETFSVVGLQVKGASPNNGYVVETSSDGMTWQRMALASIEGDDALYFTRDADEYLYGHDAAYLRLTVPGQTTFSVSEIDVFGPEGDDAEFLMNGIGLLSKDEVLGTTESGRTETIPAGSLVFVGTYKGNPAFNALLLFDQDGNILGGLDGQGFIRAKEVIFAPEVAAGAKLGDVKEGFWVYYIEKEHLPSNWQASISKVKAELYRVDNAHTLEGQRLVADTLMKPIPANLNEIDLSFGQVKQPEPEAQTPQGTEQQAAAAGTEQGAEGQQSGSAVADTADLSGYSYDLADLYGNEMGANDAQNAAAVTPLYDSPIDQKALANASAFEMSSRAMGTPIYDDETPMAASPHTHRSLAQTTVRSLGETFIVVIEDANIADVMRNFG